MELIDSKSNYNLDKSQSKFVEVIVSENVQLFN